MSKKVVKNTFIVILKFYLFYAHLFLGSDSCFCCSVRRMEQELKSVLVDDSIAAPLRPPLDAFDEAIVSIHSTM